MFEYRKGSLDLYPNITIECSSNLDETISTHSTKTSIYKIGAKWASSSIYVGEILEGSF